MRKLRLTLIAGGVMMVAGLLTLTAGAMPLVGETPAKNYSPVVKVACNGPGPRCPWGTTWRCGPYGGCGCVACGGWYRPWRY